VSALSLFEVEKTGDHLFIGLVYIFFKCSTSTSKSWEL